MNYVKEFLAIDSLDSDEELTETLLFLSIAVLSDIILDKVYFKRNKDLKHFTKDVLLESYNDYLFDSRPILYARIIKDLRVYSKENPELFLKLENNIQNFVFGKYEEKVVEDKNLESNNKKSKKHKTSNKKIIEDWRSIIDS